MDELRNSQPWNNIIRRSQIMKNVNRPQEEIDAYLLQEYKNQKHAYNRDFRNKTRHLNPNSNEYHLAYAQELMNSPNNRRHQLALYHHYMDLVAAEAKDEQKLKKYQKRLEEDPNFSQNQFQAKKEKLQNRKKFITSPQISHKPYYYKNAMNLDSGLNPDEKLGHDEMSHLYDTYMDELQEIHDEDTSTLHPNITEMFRLT
jgi:exonuclease VII large subunit